MLIIGVISAGPEVGVKASMMGHSARRPKRCIPDRLRLIVYVLVVPNLVEKPGRDTRRQSGSALWLLYSHQQFYGATPGRRSRTVSLT